MTSKNTIDLQPKPYGRIIQFIAILTAISLIIPTTLFMHGQILPFLETVFNFDTAGIITKILLACSMILLALFHRPRSVYLRFVIGLFASAALIYANYGAFTNTLVPGDALLYFIGCLLALAETAEAKLPHRTNLSARALHRTPEIRT